MSMTIDVARRIVDACKQRARELRSPVSIAIVDAGGHLVLFERMMAPYGWATDNISIAKATTAVMFNQSTDAVAQWGTGIPGFASSMAAMSDGRFIMAAGGWPIRMNGATIGGIGVSGGNAPGRDDEIARIGLTVAEALGAPAAQAQPQYQQPVPQSRPLPPMQPVYSYPSVPPNSAPQPQPQPPQFSQPSSVSGQQEARQGTGTNYLTPEGDAPSSSSSESYNSSDSYGSENIPFDNNRSGGQS